MFCPKCKSEIPENAIRCAKCGVKVRSKCPSCGALNKATELKCTNCGYELLKKCLRCGAYNLPTATSCRKCNSSLVIKQQIEIVEPEKPVKKAATSAPKEHPSTFSTPIQSIPAPKTQLRDTLEMDEAGGDEERVFSEQEVPTDLPKDEKEQLEVKSLIVNSLINSENPLCSLIAPDGRGKSYILDFIKQDLINAKITVLSMEATPVTQLSPFGVFQDLFLTASGLPNYFVEASNKENEIIKAIEQNFSLTSDDACLLFNLLYPTQNSYYEEILHNKIRTFNLIKKIFANVKTQGEVVLAIDDFDLIDGSSFELLAELYKDGIIDENFKLFVTAQNQRNIDGFIQLTQMPVEKVEKFFMGAFSEENTAALMKNILNGFEPIPPNLQSIIIKESQGSPSYIGQILLYMNESGMFDFDGKNLTCNVNEYTFTPPSDTAAIFNKRIDKIKAELPQIYRALVFIAMLGVKFNMVMLQAVMNLEQAGIEELIQQLSALAIIKPYGGEWFKFSNTLTWKYLFDYVKKDDIWAQCSLEMLNTIEPLYLSNIAYKPLMAQSAKENTRAFEYWSYVVHTALYIGDVNLYVLAQKQCLKLNTEMDLQNKILIDTNIKLRLGKLLCVTEPELALDYLTAILGIDLDKEDTTDFIDVAASALIAANHAKNYNAVIDIVDNVVKLLPPDKYKLEIALINARKIKTMLHLGSYEQLINVIQNDINPHLEDALSQNYTVYNLPISKIFETWLEANLVLVEAYIIQGNNKVYDVIATLEEALAAHVVDLEDYKLRLTLEKAFALIVKGEIHEAERLIETVIATHSSNPLGAEFACRINLLQVLLKFFKKDFSNIKAYLYETVTFANNAGDYLGKNLLKSALGKVLENEGDFNKAFEIYNDQITYFAKEHVALGALLTWYLIAGLCLKVSDVDKSLEVAINALDVAKNPKINSFYFQVMYKRLIAEIYLLKGDFEAAKMYIEKSLLITKKFNLEYLNIQLYDFYAKYHIEMFKAGNDGGSSPLVSAKKLYEKAIMLASRLGLLKTVDEIKKEYQALLTFAQLKKVVLT